MRSHRRRNWPRQTWRLICGITAAAVTALALALSAGESPFARAPMGPFGHVDPVARRPDAISRAPDLDATQIRRFCSEDPGVPIVPITTEVADSLGSAYASFNAAMLAYVDSLLRAGALGNPKDREAQRTAHLMGRMLAVNSLHYMVGLSTSPNTVFEANEAVLRHAFTKYSDPGVYPIARMKRGRMGLGQVCIQYDLDTDMETTMILGNQRLRVRVQETELFGEPRRMLIMELPTFMFSVIEVLMDEYFTCKAELIHSNGPPSPYDLYVFHSMSGMYVRKWGTHRPHAFMYWSTPRDLFRVGLPRTPLVGSCVYVPGVQLDLPSILPNVGFEDLRAVDLPQPILALTDLEAARYPAWIRRAKPRGFKDWETYGPIPPDLQIRFPDR